MVHRGHLGSKSEKWDLLILIIVLEDATYRLDSREILILLNIEIMKGILLCVRSVRESEIYS
jgi:hypothetical protein